MRNVKLRMFAAGLAVLQRGAAVFRSLGCEGCSRHVLVPSEIFHWRLKCELGLCAVMHAHDWGINSAFHGRQTGVRRGRTRATWHEEPIDLR